MLMVAPGIPAPVASCTIPLSEASVCARADGEASAIMIVNSIEVAANRLN
jgi:hypothetical protein